MTSKPTKTAAICRICLLGTQEKYFSLFEPFKGYSPAYHINSITNLNISNEDSLPVTICTACLLELENAINFKLKCETSDAYLQRTFADINIDESIAKSEEFDAKTCDVKIEKSDDCPNYEADYLEKDRDEEFSSNFWNDDIEKTDYDLSLVPVEDNDVKVDVPANSPVICNDCGQVFKSKCKLRVHWKKEHKQNYLDCDLCKARFSSRKPFLRHKIKNKETCKKLKSFIIDGFGKNRIFTCPICKYSNRRTTAILVHWRIHTGEKNFTCSLCNKSFGQKGTLDTHIEEFHRLFKKTITCEICGAQSSRSKFQRHMLKHTSPQLECDYCHKKFKQKETLRHHIKIHQGIKNYSCELCGKQFYTSSGVINHRNSAHLNKVRVKSKKFDCPLCPYRSNNKEAMDNHISRHDNGEFPCELCKHYFPSELFFWVHRLCHLSSEADERRTCPFCGKMFGNYDLMRKHLRGSHLEKTKKKQDYDLDAVIKNIKAAWASGKKDIKPRCLKAP